MTTYNLQRTSLYDKQKATSGACKPSIKSCIDLEDGPMARHGNVLQLSIDSMKKQAEKRYNKSPVLAVGDFVEVFEFPTYAKLDELSIFHDCAMGDFRVQAEIADVLEAIDANGNYTRTVTPRAAVTALTDKEAGTTVTTGAAAAAMGVIGAAIGRDVYHFANVRNNHRAVVRLKVTAVPAAPAAGQPPAANFFDLKGFNLFAAFQRYASCVCASSCAGAYDKDAVTAIA
jgi:hypothetical protein